MVEVRAQVWIVTSTDVTNRYLTVEFEEIPRNWYEWKHKIVVSPSDRGLVYDRKQDLDIGIYPVYVGLTCIYPGTYWIIDVKVTDYTGRVLGEWKNVTIVADEVLKRLGTITVNVPPGAVKLTVTAGTGGSVKVSIASPPTADTVPAYAAREYIADKGSSVILEAVPSSGYRFVKWTVDGATNTSTFLSFCIMADTTVTATFESVPTPPSGYYNLTYNVGNNGKLDINGVTYTGSGYVTFKAGTQLTIKAIPDQGYQIDQFTVAGEPVVGTDTKTITLNSNVQVSVSFKEAEKGGTWGLDPEWWERFRKQVLEPMMNAMMTMSMMMALIQTMTGMMHALAAGAF